MCVCVCVRERERERDRDRERERETERERVRERERFLGGFLLLFCLYLSLHFVEKESMAWNKCKLVMKMKTVCKRSETHRTIPLPSTKLSSKAIFLSQKKLFIEVYLFLNQDLVCVMGRGESEFASGWGCLLVVHD